MKYPYKKLVIPSELEKLGNGKLKPAMLASVKCGGKMYKPVAAKFNELYDAALEAGHKLKNIGDYRPYEAQLRLFEERYSIKDEGRKPTVTRVVDGKTYFLKKGCSPSSSPGKSNHGFGLAIDVGVERAGKLVALASDKKALQWMCANAPTWGFYLQSDDPKSPEFEAWHWQYCQGA
jgi:LAS superfamily LD-carboxypeptidase LdcB